MYINLMQLRKAPCYAMDLLGIYNFMPLSSITTLLGMMMEVVWVISNQESCGGGFIRLITVLFKARQQMKLPSSMMLAHNDVILIHND
jgi:hypothetical protein